ncbi:MAG: [protein-PII] uridylyltransferase [Planctomycetaceae bacterium]
MARTTSSTTLSSPLIDSVVLDARQRLRDGRQKIRKQHDLGAPGPQVCAQITDLFDGVILDIWNAATKELLTDSQRANLALIAHGGYGRRDLAPYSDVDIMLMPLRGANAIVQPVAAKFSRDIVDAGLQLGFSVRGPGEACRLAWSDPIIFSSLSESRLLSGSLHIYSRFFNALRRGARRRRDKLVTTLQKARREERIKWGETNYLLRPNVKRSRGGLRDLQLIRWIGFVCDGESEPDRLVKLGRLPADDFRRIRQASAFLLRVRNELHFEHGRCQDVLDRPTQMNIAQKWGYQPSEGRLPVEFFMQDYFEHTRNVRYASSYVYADARKLPLLSRMVEQVMSRRIDESIRMGPHHVWVEPKVLPTFAKNVGNVLRLMDLANRYRRRISHPTWQAIREAMITREPATPDESAIRSFLSLMSRPGHLADLLRRLNELRVLEQFVPAMKRARGLLQFNEYHKYTVDAHCIRAVEAATSFEEKAGPIGDRYRQLDDKMMLHLSLLIHDLGKGFEEDHSDVGKRVAEETAIRLGLDEASSQTLQWLVHKHLIMHYAAFRHDLSDPQIVGKFADAVGTPQRLELLTLMSLADLTAVGPDVLTDWKEYLIEDLYSRTAAFFKTGQLPGEPSPQSAMIREEIRQSLAGVSDPVQAESIVRGLSEAVIQRGPASYLAQLIRDAVNGQQPGTTICRGRFEASRGATEYTVVTNQQNRPIGIFARATAALADSGLSILKADIETLEGDWVWDTFLVEDRESTGVSDHRIAKVAARVRDFMIDESRPISTRRRYWSPTVQSESETIKLQPAKVSFDNETMDRYTIVLIFAYDRPGLLASIASTLASLRIVLHFAKIDTHLDQAVDVFYVTELGGAKIVDPKRLEQIRTALLDAAASQSDDH